MADNPIHVTEDDLGAMDMIRHVALVASEGKMSVYFGILMSIIIQDALDHLAPGVPTTQGKEELLGSFSDIWDATEKDWAAEQAEGATKQ